LPLQPQEATNPSGPSQYIDRLPLELWFDPAQPCGFHIVMKPENRKAI